MQRVVPVRRSRLATTLSSASRLLSSRRLQLEGLFLSSLLLQIQKVNAHCWERAVQINERLDRIAPCMTTGKLIGAVQTDRPLSTPRETLKELVLSPFVSHDTRQAIMLFSALADELDAMRRYALLNFLAVAKVVKKHDKLSLLPLKATLSTFIADQPFLTGRPLQRLLANARHFDQLDGHGAGVQPVRSQPTHLSVLTTARDEFRLRSTLATLRTMPR